MAKYITIFLCWSIVILSACQKQNKKKPVNNIGVVALPNCKALSPLVNNTPINSEKAAFSTSERKIAGLVLVEFADINDINSVVKHYQHPSWKSAGWLGPLAFDALGNIYVTPAPTVNTLSNPPEKQNIIYKVDGKTGDMQPFIDLPKPEMSETNPYGLLGLVYDCETRFLYASSVAGSTIDKELGRIFSISTENGTAKVVDYIDNIDAMGLCPVYINGEKRLFLGKTRTSDIYSVVINDDGSFDKKTLRRETTLADAGPRGDDRVRKIRFSAQGEMIVAGIEFYYNLIAPTEKQETNYLFRYNMLDHIWEMRK